MKKSILNLGKTLNKVEQRTVNGGFNNQNSCERMGGTWYQCNRMCLVGWHLPPC